MASIMAEEAKAPAVVEDVKPADESTRSKGTPAESAGSDAKPADDGDEPASGEAAEDAKPAAPAQDTPADDAIADDAKVDTEKTGEDTVAASTDTAATNGTPVSTKKTAANRRKSGAGVPEHKKKTPKKGKAAPVPRLNVKPGEMFLVAMRGYPLWPVVVCDEEMLPETLLSKRPVAAMRIDGQYREDFADGGKNAIHRKYPVMFLGTNEFAWELNTNLQTIDIDAIKEEVAAGNSQKKSKDLWKAFEIASEEHDLQWFKEMLEEHEKAMQVDADEKAVAEAKKLEKKEKKEKATKRKSSAAVESEEVEMGDAEDMENPISKPKATKKRKKDDESDVESEKPAKTPKAKLKLNNKAPKEASAKKRKEPKAKKAKVQEESEETAEPRSEPKAMTEAELREKQEKSVLYFRHRLQKGFLARDQAPKAEEMSNMNDYLKQLEELPNLEAETIRKTKVHKVLKAIVKLNSIPKEDEYNFKKRAADLLQSWSGALASEEPVTDAPAPATNGIKHDEEKKDVSEPATENKEVSAEKETPKSTDGDGDVAMAEASDDIAKDEPKNEPKEDVPATAETAP